MIRNILNALILLSCIAANAQRVGNFAFVRYNTKAELDAYVPPTGGSNSYRAHVLSTNRYYLWTGAIWIDEAFATPYVGIAGVAPAFIPGPSDPIHAYNSVGELWRWNGSAWVLDSGGGAITVGAVSTADNANGLSIASGVLAGHSASNTTYGLIKMNDINGDLMEGPLEQGVAYVTGLQGNPVLAITPADTLFSLMWTSVGGGSWGPKRIYLNGDAVGNHNNNKVTKIQGRAVSSTAPTTGQVLKWDGTQWLPSADATGGGGGTNLSVGNITGSTLDVISDTGNDATIPAATTTNAGLISGASQTKLDNVSTSISGDVSASINNGGAATSTINNGVVTNAKLATMPANTIKGNNTGSAAAPLDLTPTQVTAMLNAMVGATSGTGGTKGLVPAPVAGDQTKFLRGDGTWQTVSGGGGGIVTYSAGAGAIVTATATGITFTRTTASQWTFSIPSGVELLSFDINSTSAESATSALDIDFVFAGTRPYNQDASVDMTDGKVPIVTTLKKITPATYPTTAASNNPSWTADVTTAGTLRISTAEFSEAGNGGANATTVKGSF